jgi:hypothetical protein
MFVVGVCNNGIIKIKLKKEEEKSFDSSFHNDKSMDGFEVSLCNWCLEERYKFGHKKFDCEVGACLID